MADIYWEKKFRLPPDLVFFLYFEHGKRSENPKKTTGDAGLESGIDCCNSDEDAKRRDWQTECNPERD